MIPNHPSCLVGSEKCIRSNLNLLLFRFFEPDTRLGSSTTKSQSEHQDLVVLRPEEVKEK